MECGEALTIEGPVNFCGLTFGPDLIPHLFDLAEHNQQAAKDRGIAENPLADANLRNQPGVSRGVGR
jgi:hypothetical protein